MVHDEARRRDGDLDPVAGRSGQLHDTITTSFSGLKDRHSTSDIPSTPAPAALEI